MKVYNKLALSFNALCRCKETGNDEWIVKHTDTINAIIDKYFPHGSGIDAITEFDFDRSKENRIYINSSFHVMNEAGYYDGWINFTVRITPSLSFGIDLLITGNFGKHQDIKDYLYMIITEPLSEEYEKCITN